MLVSKNAVLGQFAPAVTVTTMFTHAVPLVRDLPFVRALPVLQDLPVLQALPATGSGTAVLTSGAHLGGPFASLVTMLAVWTLVMAVCAVVRMLPKSEA
ncbi:MAG: hypothetical protein ACR2OO_14640 [Thermomicrobiales bacterium]